MKERLEPQLYVLLLYRRFAGGLIHLIDSAPQGFPAVGIRDRSPCFLPAARNGAGVRENVAYYYRKEGAPRWIKKRFAGFWKAVSGAK